METLIIQQANRHGSLSEFIKSSSANLTLGRGFNNDVILSDHFIAPEQLRFYYEEGQWKLKLLDFTNAIMINGKPVVGTEVTIHSGDRLTVGRTHLVLLLSDHPVERTRKLVMSNWMNNKHQRIILPLILLLLSALVTVLIDYQEMTGKIHWGQLFSSGLAFMVLIVFWTSIWALVGRVLRHRPNFFEQLFYTALTGITLNVGRMFAGYTEYATSSETFAMIIESGFILLVLGMLLKYNLSYATALNKRGWISFSLVALLMAFSFSNQYSGKLDFNTRPEYSQIIKPPFAKLSADSSIDAYLHNFESQLDVVEKWARI